MNFHLPFDVFDLKNRRQELIKINNLQNTIKILADILKKGSISEIYILKGGDIRLCK